MNRLVNDKEIKTYDRVQRKEIKMPVDMAFFLDEIINVCVKHRLSLSHEDGYGAFIIERYSEYNIERLKAAMKNY